MIFVSISVWAECQYQTYHIKFMIETTDGKMSNGYTKASPCYFSLDSISNLSIEYFKKNVAVLEAYYNEDSLTYFQDRIEYEYLFSEYSEEKSTEYYLLNKKTIPVKDIKTIKVDNVIDQSGWMSIENTLQLKDTIWMKEEPIKRVDFEPASSEGYGVGFLYGYRIFVHVNSKKTDAVIRELDLKWKELVTEKTLEEVNNNTSEINEEIRKIVKKFKGEKVIVISEFSD